MDKTKKKNVRRYILWGVLAVVVAGLALLPALARQQDAQDGPVASVLEATVKEGSVQATVRGGGTLEAGDGEDIKLPAEVKITEFLVKNGQEVKKGDPVAKIDKVSALTAVTEIRTSMAAVEKQMETFSDEKSASTVTAPAGGRVKAIYANPGDSVTQVLVEHGALALLSLDGRMCVTLTVSSQLIPGDSIPVTLDSGKTVTGRVESNLNGELTVTIADNGYAVGDTVTLEGLGSGSLEIHNPWLATAFNGTVSQVNIRLEQTVSSGGSLFTLKDTDYTAQRELLAETHRDYEELLQKLLTWQDTGVITAPCDGLVSGIDTDSTHLLAAEDEELTASLLNADDGDFRLVFLSNVTMEDESPCTKDASCPLPDGDDNHDPSCPHACNQQDSCKAVLHFEGCPHNCTGQTGCTAKYHKDGCPEKCTGDVNCKVTNPENHKSNCPLKCINAKGCTALYHLDTCPEKCTEDADCKASVDNHNPNCPKYCSCDANCHATEHRDGCPKIVTTKYTGFVAKVDRVVYGVVYLSIDNATSSVVVHTNKWNFGSLNTTNPTGLVPSNDPFNVTPGSVKEGDIVVVAYPENGGDPIIIPTGNSIGGTPNLDLSGLMAGMGGFSMGGYGGTGSGSSTQLYSLDGDVLLTVTPLDTMTVTIAVDEKDIASVKTGMTAQLTMNALPDETFEGQVTRVAQTGSGNGGSSKFDVEITLSRESDMLPGMSTTAQLTLYEKMDVLTLPVAALRDEGGKTLVYTGKDKKTGEPANPVEVTTGLSDGENVEILSGIDSGTTVYYLYYDTVTESDAVETEHSMF